MQQNYATNQSATDVFGKENLQKEWIATLDERVRIDHAEANGQVVDMDKNFLVGGEELAYPGDSRGSAANVINCRCTNAPFPKELEENYSSGGCYRKCYSSRNYCSS